MRTAATILHLDLDAFYASVEQRDKPSLRGKPVVVGGVGGRGVVSTASYEARAFGVRSAMSTREARARCPQAAYLSVRFPVYHEASRAVMSVLKELSPLVEPLSLDEAFVDLAAGQVADTDLAVLGHQVKQEVSDRTGGLTCSVGIGTSKLMAKIASDLRKPDGLVVVPPGTEQTILDPLPVSSIPGVGPATAERLRRIGIGTVAELTTLEQPELVRLLGQAQGTGLFHLARGDDDRPVVADRETKSISVEDTYDTDVADPRLMAGLVDRQAVKVSERLRKARLSGRTVTVKVRLYDFTTHTRSTTLTAPTDDPRVVRRTVKALLADLETEGGVRLLGVGVSGLADWIQDDLFDDLDGAFDDAVDAEAELPDLTRFERRRGWAPGADVVHRELGRGWVWGSGLGRVTVRFEVAGSPPGPVRTFADDDPDLEAWSPAPIRED